MHQPPAARLARVANSALFILHFFSTGAAEISGDLPSSLLSIIQRHIWAIVGERDTFPSLKLKTF